MNKVTKFAVVLVAAALWIAPSPAEAGGSWGGSSSGGFASSGGGSSGGGGFFSRLRARHSGSSGGRVSVGRANHGSSGGSSGGARRGPIRNLIAKMRARHSGSHGGSRGGSSGGHVQYTSYRGGSSGGSVGGSSGGRAVAYSAPTSYGSYSAPIASAPLAESSVYESPIIESSYQTYAPASVNETIVDSGYSTGETIIDSGYNSGETIIDSGYDLGIPQASNSSDQSDVATIDSDRYEVAKPPVDEDAAVLAVRVPESANVTVNGHATKSDGEIRQFMSRGLKKGFVYTYVVKVTYDGDDKAQSKTIDLRPGDYEEIAFERKSPVQQVAARKPAIDDSVITVVQLHVPTRAEVSLSGTLTKGSGELRTFRTKQLKRGEQWTDYTVSVTADINGQSITKERTVNVQAGSVTELTFDFNDTPLASR